MSQEKILYTVRDRVATITLNRPELKNALDQEALDKLVAAINAVKKNPEYQKAVEEGGYSVDMGDIKEFANRIDRELNMWGQVITKGNIQAQ